MSIKYVIYLSVCYKSLRILKKYKNTREKFRDYWFLNLLVRIPIHDFFVLLLWMLSSLLLLERGNLKKKLVQDWNENQHICQQPATTLHSPTQLQQIFLYTTTGWINNKLPCKGEPDRYMERSISIDNKAMVVD